VFLSQGRAEVPVPQDKMHRQAVLEQTAELGFSQVFLGRQLIMPEAVAEKFNKTHQHLSVKVVQAAEEMAVITARK